MSAWCVRCCSCCADMRENCGPHGIDCSALLSLQRLKALSVDGWRLYITPLQRAGSAGAALMLTELSTNVWMHDEHEVLLDAAVRGG